MPESARIKIEPADPVEMVEDLDQLAEALRELGYEAEVAERPRRGYGVTWWEVFHIFVEQVGEHGIDAVLGATAAAFVDWARRRFREGKGRPAPKAATLYGPDGKPVKMVELHAEDQDPVEKDVT
jgi:hypothetical protein